MGIGKGNISFMVVFILLNFGMLVVRLIWFFFEIFLGDDFMVSFAVVLGGTVGRVVGS